MWDIAVIPDPASKGRLAAEHLTFWKKANSGQEPKRLAE